MSFGIFEFSKPSLYTLYFIHYTYMVSIILDWLLNFLFPPRCLICQTKGGYFCPGCQGKLVFLSCQVCPVCGQATLDGRVHEYCQTKYSLNGLSNIFSYSSPLREAIKRVKYKPYLFDAISELARLAIPHFEKDDDFILLREFLAKKPIIVPIPLFSRRYRERGYNHARIIAQSLAQEWHLRLEDDLLVRVKNTRPQSFLKAEERAKNIKSAFAVNRRRREKSPPILLVDDIWTTGATMRTAGNVLKRAGFPEAWGLTLCR